MLGLCFCTYAPARASFTVLEDETQIMLIEDSNPAPVVSGWDTAEGDQVRQIPPDEDTLVVIPEAVAENSQLNMAMEERAEAEEIYRQAENCYYSGDFAGAVRLMRENLDLNYAPMQELLGLCYYLGYGTRTDDNEAYRLFCLAADQGWAGALYCKARSTELGYGTAANHDAARRMYEQAASAMETQAQSEKDLHTRGRLYYFLGCAYVYGGQGVKQNVEKGLDYLNQALSMGDSSAAYSLGYFYRNGGEIGYFTCQKDPSQALRCFEDAARGGIPDALYRAGMMYLNGEGTTADTQKGLIYLQLASEAGIPEASKAVEEWLAANS